MNEAHLYIFRLHQSPTHNSSLKFLPTKTQTNQNIVKTKI